MFKEIAINDAKIFVGFLVANENVILRIIKIVRHTDQDYKHPL